jgi:hypothetical protein
MNKVIFVKFEANQIPAERRCSQFETQQDTNAEHGMFTSYTGQIGTIAIRLAVNA